MLTRILFFGVQPRHQMGKDLQHTKETLVRAGECFWDGQMTCEIMRLGNAFPLQFKLERFSPRP